LPGWPLIHLPLPSPPDEGIAMKPEAENLSRLHGFLKTAL
jgi:hypothetical protein